ncbi:hypothetical protein E2C01_092342 [Portunus trituberculatus]|uniref:Uncharacterized protein n=1 Tax=Portunus trituberculatus TaxID=210409 RepID=A0A5B7JRG8_PORTR|nr:hypothetical protein [Portunus trituberculatus]
MTTLHHQLQ